jgi:hypothetical protein
MILGTMDIDNSWRGKIRVYIIDTLLQGPPCSGLFLFFKMPYKEASF